MMSMRIAQPKRDVPASAQPKDRKIGMESTELSNSLTMSHFGQFVVDFTE